MQSANANQVIKNKLTYGRTYTQCTAHNVKVGMRSTDSMLTGMPGDNPRLSQSSNKPHVSQNSHVVLRVSCQLVLSPAFLTPV